MQHFPTIVVTLALGLAQGLAHAQQDWPRRFVTLIVPNQIGGAYDAAARPLGQALSQALGQPFVIDNQPAGSGVVGLVKTAKSAADGYTLLFTGQGQVSLYPILRASLPYDPQKDLTPIIRIGSLESFLMVHPSLPAKSMKELADLARAKPDTITFGTWGNISTSNMYVEYLKKARNVAFYAVPYKSAAQALAAGVSGEVQVTLFGQGQATALIKAGKFRPIAATGRQRSSFLPDIPTMKETGIGFELEPSSWVGLFAPAGTPRPIVTRVNAEAAKLLADRAYAQKALLAFGFAADEPNSPEEFAKFLVEDRQTYTELIRITGIKDD